MWYKNIAGRFFGLVKKHSCDSDRRTDGQTDRITTPKTALAYLRRAVKTFLLLGLAAEYRCRRWMWSTLLPTVRSLWHSPANQVDSAWDDQSFQGYGCARQNLNASRDLTTPLSGMPYHPRASNCYRQSTYQIWSLYLHSLRRYKRRYKMSWMGRFGVVSVTQVYWK